LLKQTVEACSDHYFHFRHQPKEDAPVCGYHQNKTKEITTLLESTIKELKGVL
jgi:hypothetical protein